MGKLLDETVLVLLKNNLKWKLKEKKTIRFLSWSPQWKVVLFETINGAMIDWAVFKWLSKVITWLRLLRLVIGLNESCQFFNQWEAKPKPKPIAPCTRDFSRASSEWQVIARNCDWFIAPFVPVVIGRSICFGVGFSTVILKALYIPSDKVSFCFFSRTVGNAVARSIARSRAFSQQGRKLWSLFSYFLFSSNKNSTPYNPSNHPFLYFPCRLIFEQDHHAKRA